MPEHLGARGGYAGTFGGSRGVVPELLRASRGGMPELFWAHGKGISELLWAQEGLCRKFCGLGGGGMPELL